jgi:hypothetical protein
LLWEHDPARFGPPLQDPALLGVRRAVGKSTDLDRPALTVEFDRQQPVGIASGSAA